MGDEPIRAILQAMFPWVNMTKVQIPANVDFETRWHFDRNKGLSYFAMLGDEFQDGACELEDGRVCELKIPVVHFQRRRFLASDESLDRG